MIRYPGVNDAAGLVIDAARLAADLKRIAAGRGPTATELDAAPLLDGWGPGLLPQLVLGGAVHDHPLLGTRPIIRTSPIYAFDIECGWARSWSQFYRLGATADERAGGCNG